MNRTIQKPTKDELTPLFIEATQNQKAEEWEQKLIDGIVGILHANPLRYRCYGPYWWLLKSVLIDRDVMDFGNHVDREWFESLDYGDPGYNLLASWVYEDTRFGTGQMITNPYHVLTDQDGESFEFACNDEEMEALAAAKTMLK